MTTTTDILSLVVEGARQAQEYIDTYANARGRETYEMLAASGRLELQVGFDPDGQVWGQYYDRDRIPCWDGCDGVLTEHRPGWCPFVPEHADLDCGCGYSNDPEDYLTDEDEARLYGDYEPDLDDEGVDPDQEDALTWLAEVGDDLDEAPFDEPDPDAFDEDYAITQAENRYEKWLGRT